jgi:hypothetical protein
MSQFAAATVLGGKMPYCKSEINMWDKPIKDFPETLTDEEINEKYRAGEERIVTETNREKLPNFVRALDKESYMQIRPFYQRRERWDVQRQSRLIESFIMNVPVPPLFLYEKDFNQYEVMDGQQRISALKAFYAGEYKLKGLAVWHHLNGRTYSTLPSQIRQGLDRRSISYIVVLRESTQDEEDAVFLRQTVFERLNTGGVELAHQEIRNCLFQGTFNDMVIKLTQSDDFRDSFGMPRYTADETEPNAAIKKISTYQKLEDAEIVLRFFALRHASKYTRGMHGFLDLYMNRARSFTKEDILLLRAIFQETIRLARSIYNGLVFCPFDTDSQKWATRPHKAFYDAVMVALSTRMDKADAFTSKKEIIIEKTKQLFISNPQGTFTGRGNTKIDIQDRIRIFGEMLDSVA